MRIGDRKKEIERDIVTALYLSKKQKTVNMIQYQKGKYIAEKGMDMRQAVSMRMRVGNRKKERITGVGVGGVWGQRPFFLPEIHPFC